MFCSVRDFGRCTSSSSVQSTQSTTREECFCGHEYCKEVGQDSLTFKSDVF